MHFLPDVWVVCDACHGARFTPETLAVKFRGKTIADVLNMNVDAALELFSGVPKIRKVMQTLHDVGLGYLPLWASPPPRSREARPSASSSPPNSPGPTPARPYTSSTSRPPASTSTTSASSWTWSTVWPTWATRSSSSSTTSRSSRPPTGSSTSAPRPGGEGGSVVAAGPPEVIAVDRRGRSPGRSSRASSPPARFEERPRFDPKAAARKLPSPRSRPPRRTKSGPEALAPWEKDGRRWHTRRTGRPLGQARPLGWPDPREGGRPPRADRWLPGHRLDPDGPWSGSPRVDPEAPPFLQAQTGHEWVLTLRFTVKRNAFKPETLARQLNLAPFHEARRPVLSDAERLSFGEPKGGFQEVVLTCHALEEVATDAFDAFLVKAAVSYQNAVRTEGPDEVEAIVAQDAPGWKEITKAGVGRKVRSS